MTENINKAKPEQLLLLKLKVTSKTSAVLQAINISVITVLKGVEIIAMQNLFKVIWSANKTYPQLLQLVKICYN